MKKSIKVGTLAYPCPVWCVGSYDAEGKANVMTIAWGGICCSSPPAVTVSLQKIRHSYDSIVKRGAFTVSIPSVAHVAEADYFGMASGRTTDKFADTGLEAMRSEKVDAPYVDDFPLVLECKLLKLVELGIHTQMVGEIVGILADEAILDERGTPSMEKLAPFVFGPGGGEYRALGEVVGKAFSTGKAFSK